MPEWFVVSLLAAIEGITEFLPISSTGHLLIAERWLGARQTDLFNIVIQSGAVLAVLPLFGDRLNQFLFRWRETATRDYLVKIVVAFVATCLPMYALERRGYKLPERLAPVAWALALGGLGFLIVESWRRGDVGKDRVTWPVVVAVAAGQIIAGVFPGASRSGATILLALALGLNRVAATEFTFLVGIPTMLAAGGWKIIKALHHPAPGAPAENWGMVALGTVVASAVSFVAVRWLLRYIQTHSFIVFGWYRLALAALIALLLLG